MLSSQGRGLHILKLDEENYTWIEIWNQNQKP